MGSNCIAFGFLLYGRNRHKKNKETAIKFGKLALKDGLEKDYFDKQSFSPYRLNFKNACNKFLIYYFI